MEKAEITAYTVMSMVGMSRLCPRPRGILCELAPPFPTKPEKARLDRTFLKAANS